MRTVDLMAPFWKRRISSAATAKRFGKPVPSIWAASSGASWGDHGMPDGCARWPPRAMRRLRCHPHRLQLLSQSALSEVPGLGARAWLAERQAELLPVPYFHVVFTLPAPTREIAFQNKAVVYATLFRCAAETLTTIAADSKHLGAQLGVTAVLHTWGQTLQHHPHIHCVVPGGWTFARRHARGRLRARLLPVSACPLPAIPPPIFARVASCLCGWRAGLLWRSRPSRRSRCIRRAP